MTKKSHEEIKTFLRRKGIDCFVLLIENESGTYDLIRRYYPDSFLEILGDTIKKMSVQPKKKTFKTK